MYNMSYWEGGIHVLRKDTGDANENFNANKDKLHQVLKHTKMIDMNNMEIISESSAFSVVWADDKDVVVRSYCPVKLAIAEGLMPNPNDFGIPNAYYPPITKIDSDGIIHTLTMPKYRSGEGMTKFLNPLALSLFRTLLKLRSYLNENFGVYDYNDLYKVINERVNDGAVKEFLIASINGLSNYGCDMAFEPHVDNLAVDKDGNLVLLDIWYFRGMLSKITMEDKDYKFTYLYQLQN